MKFLKNISQDEMKAYWLVKAKNIGLDIIFTVGNFHEQGNIIHQILGKEDDCYFRMLYEGVGIYHVITRILFFAKFVIACLIYVVVGG